MIKIIKNTMTEPIPITCNFCKSDLTYNYQDIQREEYRDPLCILGDQKRSKRYLVCPVCKSTLSLDVKAVVKVENKTGNETGG